MATTRGPREALHKDLYVEGPSIAWRGNWRLPQSGSPQSCYGKIPDISDTASIRNSIHSHRLSPADHRSSAAAPDPYGSLSTATTNPVQLSPVDPFKVQLWLLLYGVEH